MAETALTKTDQNDIGLSEWGDRHDVAGLGRRIRALMPGGQKLSNEQAMGLAQYAIATGLNPFRGEVYGYTDSHGFHLVEGYKAITRWAQRQCPYSERFVELTEADRLPDGAIGYRCYILRDDDKHKVREFVDMGATFFEAFETVAHSAVGIVTASDMTSKNGYPIDAPKGWTWDEVARKRALKNALNRSHGAPTVKEIAAGSWEVDGQPTRHEDWTIAPSETISQAEAEANAKLNASYRRAIEERGNRPPDTAVDAVGDLFGDEAAENFASTVRRGMTEDECNELVVRATTEYGLTTDELITALAVDDLTDFEGDFTTAVSILQEWIAAHSTDAA